MKVPNWYFGIGLLAVVIVLPTSVGAWSYEQIDTAGSWSRAEIEVMPGGTICVCYQDTVSHAIMLASKDGLWRYETLGIGNSTVGRHLVPGPGRRPAVLTGAGPFTYKVDTDSGWVTTVLGWSEGGSPYLAFDTSGVPSVLWAFATTYYTYLSSAKESADVWIQDMIYTWIHGIKSPRYAGNLGFVVDRTNCFHLLFISEFYWTGGNFREVCLSSGSTRSWTTGVIAGGTWWFASALSLAPRPSSGATACYNQHHQSQSDTFYCDGTVIDTQPASIGLVRVDAQNRRRIVY